MLSEGLLLAAAPLPFGLIQRGLLYALLQGVYLAALSAAKHENLTHMGFERDVGGELHPISTRVRMGPIFHPSFVVGSPSLRPRVGHCIFSR